jgi:hypothetical protein
MRCYPFEAPRAAKNFWAYPPTTVAQIFNLLYRRVPLGWACHWLRRSIW